MARYTGPKWRINRRENATVIGRSDKWKKRSSVPGMYPSRGKNSEYAVQFREKQKVKRTYGMSEKQFRKFFREARKSTGNTGTRLLQLLEMRVDNILFKLGFANTRDQARQFVTHGHILVNGKKHRVPSAILKAGDEIKLKDSIRNNSMLSVIVETLKTEPTPEWLTKYSDGGKVLAEPSRDMLDQSVKERLIIELYSK